MFSSLSNTTESINPCIMVDKTFTLMPQESSSGLSLLDCCSKPQILKLILLTLWNSLHNKKHLLYTFLFLFEIIVDSEEVTRVEQEDPMYPSPSFSHWLHLMNLKCNTKHRKLGLVHWAYSSVPFYYIWKFM